VPAGVVPVSSETRVYVVERGRMRQVNVNQSPFRLGLLLGFAHSADGKLTSGGAKPAAAALDFSWVGGEIVRLHLGLGHEWESKGSYGAKGFRIDLISLGFPMAVVREPVALHIEPILRIVRADILFPKGSEDRAIFRLQSGFSLMATVSYQRWFFGFEPLGLDFRFFRADTAAEDPETGFSSIWWIQFMLGREF
jgi:hypothetical protein